MDPIIIGPISQRISILVVRRLVSVELLIIGKILRKAKINRRKQIGKI